MANKMACTSWLSCAYHCNPCITSLLSCCPNADKPLPEWLNKVCDGKTCAEWLEDVNKYETFEDVPEELITRDFCFVAVKLSGLVLREVPDEFKDYELCLAAARMGGSLWHIPEKHHTYEVCLEAASWSAHPSKIPKEFRTPEMKEAILSQIDIGDNNDFRSWEE